MLGQPRIMIIDDSQTIRTEAARYLGTEFNVMTCEDGLDAIGRIARFSPALILLDIVMPKLNGYETLSIIRLNPAFKKTPIFMMSGKGGVFDIAQGRVLGFDGYITKPFKSEDLLKLVQTGLEAAQSREAEAKADAQSVTPV